MGAVSFFRAWALVGSVWLVALSVQADWTLPNTTQDSTPMPNIAAGDSNRYWFVYRQGAGTQAMQLRASVTYGSPNQKTYSTGSGIFVGPTLAIWGYANGTTPTASNWVFTPQGCVMATENGGFSFSIPWSASPLSNAQALGYDWGSSGITPINPADGKPYTWGGVPAEVPPEETIQDHKIGFTLTNNSGAPKDYYIQPTDMAGNPIDDLPWQKVTLAPGESRPFSFSRPGTGAGGAGGAFKVSVIQTDWVADPEFGQVKQESLTGTWNSVPHVVPLNNASPTPSQQSSGPGTTSSQPAAQQTQVSGTAAVTASQANTLNQNVLAELQRVGAQVKASGDVAHSDAQQILGKLGTLATGGESTDVSGVEDKLDGVKDAVEGLVDDSTLPTLPGPGAAAPSGIGEAEANTGFVGGLSSKVDTIVSRVSALSAQLESVRDALPMVNGVQSLDFTVNTARFGSFNFQLSAYESIFQLVRGGVLLVMAYYAFFTCIRLVKFAFV